MLTISRTAYSTAINTENASFSVQWFPQENTWALTISTVAGEMTTERNETFFMSREVMQALADFTFDCTRALRSEKVR